MSYEYQVPTAQTSYDPSLDENLLTSEGALMLHLFGMKCPACRREDPEASTLEDGQHSTVLPWCEKCGKDGWIYRDPQPVLGLVTGISEQLMALEPGWLEPGDMRFSPGRWAPECGNRVISERDKLVATWDQPQGPGQTIIRGAGTRGENKARNVELKENEDLLLYEPGVAIWCEDEFETRFYPDTDFVFGDGRVIRWIGNKPPDMSCYTLKYTAFFEWIAAIPPTQRIGRNGQDLGALVTLKKRHVALRNNRTEGISSDRFSIRSTARQI